MFSRVFCQCRQSDCAGVYTRENGRARFGLTNVLFVFFGNQDWENGDS